MTPEQLVVSHLAHTAGQENAEACLVEMNGMPAAVAAAGDVALVISADDLLFTFRTDGRIRPRASFDTLQQTRDWVSCHDKCTALLGI